MEALARQLVALDAVVSAEIAEHLVARALQLSRRSQADAAGTEKAERFLQLADLIERERANARGATVSSVNVASLVSATR